jgi:hypothetical protein
MTRIITAGLRAIVLAFLTALSASAISYHVFRWAFIKYWEWQHDGRRMKFAFWAEERALLAALIVFGVVFFLLLRYLRRRHAP